MKVTFYKTRLYPNYSRVVTDIVKYLNGVESYSVDIPDVNVGAQNLELSFKRGDVDPRNYNYALIGDKYYFVTEWQWIVPDTVACVMIFDHWHNTKNIRVSGRLINAHDMADIVYSAGGATARYAPIRYPVEPICGDFIRCTYDQNPRNYTTVCVLAHMTIYQGNIERDVLVNTPLADILTERYVIRGYIGNLARAEELDNNEIRSVNKIWIVPSWFPAFASGTTTSVISLGGSGVQSIGVHWDTQNFNVTTAVGQGDVSRHIFNTENPAEKVPIFVKYGNFATNISVPLNGLWSMVQVDGSFDGDSGGVSLFIRYRDESVDVLPSLSVSFSSGRISERELSRKISNAIGLVSSAGAIAAGAYTGNFPAIAGGISGLATTATDIVTRPIKTVSTVDGNAFVNLIRANWWNANATPTAICCTGFLEYSCANQGEVIDGLKRFGYGGNIHVTDFALNAPRETSVIEPNFTYTASFRRFADDAMLYIDADNITEPTREFLRAILIDGTIVYNTNNGDMIDPEINYRVQPQPAE